MNENADQGPNLSGPRPESQVSKPDSQPSSQKPPSFVSPGKPAAFYSPPPSDESPPPVGSGKRKAFLGASSLLVAAGLAVGAWYALAPTPPPGPVPVAAAQAKTEKTFRISQADADPKATAYLKSVLSGGDATAAEGAADGLHAVNGPALLALAKNSPQLAEGIKSDRIALYRIYLLDFLEEDGDHAELFVDGVSYGDLYLRNAGKEILIPMIPGKPAQMKLVATADGGGGVTVGFVSSLGEARTRIMQVGDFEQWQVIMQ